MRACVRACVRVCVCVYVNGVKRRLVEDIEEGNTEPQQIIFTNAEARRLPDISSAMPCQPILRRGLDHANLFYDVDSAMAT